MSKRRELKCKCTKFLRMKGQKMLPMCGNDFLRPGLLNCVICEVFKGGSMMKTFFLILVRHSSTLF